MSSSQLVTELSRALRDVPVAPEGECEQFTAEFAATARHLSIEEIDALSPEEFKSLCDHYFGEVEDDPYGELEDCESYSDSSEYVYPYD
jgi:hypothetical protein